MPFIKKIILVKNSIREKTCPLTDTSVILIFNFRVPRMAMKLFFFAKIYGTRAKKFV